MATPELTTMSERAWIEAWESQQARLDAVGDRRDVWLPNVVERRGWGAVRWLSGRPQHTADTGEAVPETFVVVRPDMPEQGREDVAAALRLQPTRWVLMGKGLRTSTVAAAGASAVLGVIAGIALGGIASVAWWFTLVLVLGLGVLLGAGGALGEREVRRRRRDAVLRENAAVRLVAGRFAPESWTRLLVAVTVVETRADSGQDQTVRAVHAAVWEAAGLLLTSSDHDGIEVLADGVHRLLR